MKTEAFFDLTVTAPVRLARMRRELAEKIAKYPGLNYKTWRDVRGTTYSGIAAYSGKMQSAPRNGKPAYYHFGEEQFRHEKPVAEWVDSYKKHRFSGYYTDTARCSIAYGIVGRLPHGRFIAGYLWGENDERVYYPETFQDLEDACDAADGHAEFFAKRAYEDSEKYHEARKLEIDIQDAEIRLRECIALRNKKGMSHVREEVAELCNSLRDWHETLCTDYAKYV